MYEPSNDASWIEFEAMADEVCNFAGAPRLSVAELVAVAGRRGLTVLNHGRPVTCAGITTDRRPLRLSIARDE